jgi:hypothetical protein
MIHMAQSSISLVNTPERPVSAVTTRVQGKCAGLSQRSTKPFVQILRYPAFPQPGDMNASAHPFGDRQVSFGLVDAFKN